MLSDINHINHILTPPKKKTYSESKSNPTSNKFSNLIKPDFSPLIIKENNFIPKKNGANKTRSNIEPEYPIKRADINLFSSVKIIGKDLFGAKKNQTSEKKLNLNWFGKKLLFENDNDFFQNIEIIENDYNKNCIEEKRGTDKYTIKNTFRDNIVENNFIILKTLIQDKFDAVYQVKEKESNKIFCLKRISENSNKNNFNILPTTLDDIQKENEDWVFPKTFCMMHIDYWIDDINYLNKNMYVLTEFYKRGDVMAYLEQLEKNNFVFTPEFYWDVIFEMIIGLLYIHSKGYIHFDIKPTNYLVDDDGFIILNDFGLSHKEKELSQLKDIKEGDSKYISKELFESLGNLSIQKINNKTDIFSLGLTFLEIIAKIELPLNGQLWRNLRDRGNDILSDKIFTNSNIFDVEHFLVLIKKMISPVDERPSLMELIKETPELNKRYKLLEIKKYQKSCCI